MKDLYSRIKTPMWLILSGLLTSLPLIFTELGFLQWISVIPAAIILMRYAANRNVRLGKLYGMGVLFFGAYYALSFHWFFYMYPLDFAGLSNAASLGVVLIACFGLGLFQAVQTALVFLIFGIITRNKLCERYGIIKPFCAAAYIFSGSTFIVNIMGANMLRHFCTVSTASNTASLSSCISLLYARGKPLRVVSSAIRSP